jgi:hypothetical protein
MSVTSSQEDLSEDQAREYFEGMAAQAATQVFREACIRILVYDDVIPGHIRAAFKIQPGKFLKQAFEEAVKEFESVEY